MSPTQSPPPVGDADTLRLRTAEDRAVLGDTVESLSAKTDVAGRVKSKAADLRAKAAPAAARAKQYAGKAQQAASDSGPRTRLAAAGGAVAALVTLLAVRSRRRKRQANARWYRRVGK